VVDAGSGNDAGCGFFDSFDGGFPAATWSVLGGVNLSATPSRVGWAGLVPLVSNQPYTLARVGRVRGSSCSTSLNQEVTFRVELPDAPRQGAGIYLRQNGGFLAPAGAGAGYAIFLEGFRNRRFGLWREVGGVETELLPVTVGAPLPSGVWLGRFRVEQINAGTTRLRGRVWADGTAEPTTWAEVFDSTPSLQAGGSVALDSYNTALPRDGGVDAGVLPPVWFQDLRVSDL
jgi:hypothetical protein